jgi:NhaC family Na+:H+ antiporter
MNSMSTTLVLVFTALVLAAGMEMSGALDVLMTRMLQSVRSVFALIAATMTSGLAMIG